MAKNCERCRVSEKQKFWQEFKKYQFFKIMVNEFEHRLRIPKKFVMKLKDSYEFRGHKILKGPSGNSWKVEIKRTKNDDYVFCNGWEVFAKDHNLEGGDLVVFKMDSISTFDVSIFDPTACEKEESFFVKKQRKPCKHQDEIYVIDQETSESDDYLSDSSDQENGKEYFFHSPEPSKGKKLKKILIAEQENRKRKSTHLPSHKKTIDPVSDGKRHMFSNRRQVTEKERRKVHEMATKHRSCVPSFLMTMRPTHVYLGQLKVPKRFAEKHMRKRSETINLTIPTSGRTWEVSLRCRKEGLVMQTGWEDFVMDNNLEEHDICVFELSQGGKNNMKPIVLDVIIYHVGIDEIVRPSTSDSISTD